MDVESNLESIGLTKQEARVYLTALKLGISKASVIAQKSGVQRGAVYYSLKLLKERGFLVEIIKSGVQYYNAVPPKRILELIEEEKNEKKELVKAILPQLDALKSTSVELPHIEYYEGYEGFKTIFSKVLDKSEEELRCFLSSKMLEYLPHFHEQFRKRRVAKRIKIRTISEDTPTLREIKKLDKKEFRETRFYDSIFKGEEVLQYILEDAVVIIKANKNSQTGVLIQDKEFAQFHRNLFESIWKISTK